MPIPLAVNFQLSARDAATNNLRCPRLPSFFFLNLVWQMNWSKIPIPTLILIHKYLKIFVIPMKSIQAKRSRQVQTFQTTRVFLHSWKNASSTKYNSITV